MHLELKKKLLKAVTLPIDEANDRWNALAPGECIAIFLPDGQLFAQTCDFDMPSSHYADPAAFMVFGYEADENLRCLFAEGDQRRLNKQDCVGRSLNYLDPEISFPRIAAIREAMRVGSTINYKYTHHWEGLTWYFRCTVEHFPADNLVVVNVFDDEPWQTRWWASRPV